MRIKTIVIVLITILLTIIIMQNTDKVPFTILFSVTYISKLFILLFALIAGFILGWLVARPKRAIRLGGDDDHQNPNQPGTGTLSEEDREYIN